MVEQILLGDCHTHLDQYPLAEMPEILDRARESGVAFAVCAGTTLQSTQNCINLAEMHEPLYAGVGIHPMEANDPVDEQVYAELERMAKSSSKVVCISEVGLDYLPASPDHETQDQVFRQHIRLARSLKLPVIFHSRESHPAAFKVLREENAGEVGGAMHYFQGDEATAREAIDCGFYISLARPLIRLPELQEVAKVIPLENIVLETDAAPQPFKKYRTNWTEPRHVQSVAQTLAEIKGVPVEEVARVTTGNLARLLRLERLI
ncbi:MAG: TatD family hydrolase [Dehalococcoidia bacterium]|nr:TatD family hydrolase [Dehalococcoidia bacterium]